MVLKSEELFHNPYSEMLKVCKFLNIKPYPEKLKDKLSVFNKVDYKQIDALRRKSLGKYFEKSPFDSYYRFKFV